MTQLHMKPTHRAKQEFIYKTAISFHYTGLKWSEADKAGLWAEIMGLNAIEVNKQYSADLDHTESMDSLNYRNNCGTRTNNSPPR